MINLMNLLSPAPTQQAQGSAATAVGDMALGAAPEEFLEKLQLLMGQNVAAANSASVIDFGATLDQATRQGEQATAELVAMLQLAGLLPPQIKPEELNPLVTGPLEELTAVLDQLIASLDAQPVLGEPAAFYGEPKAQAAQIPLTFAQPAVNPDPLKGKTGPQDQVPIVFGDAQKDQISSPQMKLVLAAALEKCKDLLDLQKNVLQMKGWIPTAGDPAALESDRSRTSVASVAWSLSAQIMQVEQRSASETVSQPSFPALSNSGLPSLVAVIRVRVQKITTEWKQLTGGLKASFEAAAQTGSHIEQLQTQSLWTLVRMVRSEQSQSQKPAAVQGAGENLGQVQNPVTATPAQALDQPGENLASALNVPTGTQEAPSPVQTGTEELAGKPLADIAAALPKTESPARAEANAVRLPAHIERLVMTQTLDRIRVLSRNGSQEIQIRLDPPELGRMQMKLAVDGTAVAARVTVENEAVKQILEHGLPQLRDSLSSQGLRVERFDVHVGFGFDQQPGKELRDRWNMRKGWAQRSGNEVEALAPAPAAQGDDTGKRYGYNTIELLV